MRKAHSLGDRGVKGGDVGDDMIARHHEQQRVGVGLRDGERDRGGGVARHRLDEQRLFAIAHLFAHHRDMAVAAEDNGWQEIGARGRALDGLAEQAALAVQQQELLRAGAARFGPQAGACTAAQDEGLDHQRHEFGLSLSKQRVTLSLPI